MAYLLLQKWWWSLGAGNPSPCWGGDRSVDQGWSHTACENLTYTSYNVVHQEFLQETCNRSKHLNHSFHEEKHRCLYFVLEVDKRLKKYYTMRKKPINYLTKKSAAAIYSMSPHIVVFFWHFLKYLCLEFTSTSFHFFVLMFAPTLSSLERVIICSSEHDMSTWFSI